MNNGQKSLSINETFIVEALEGDVFSACTGFYTNALISCTGNTQILLNNNIIEANSAFSATTFYGDGSNLTGISTQDTFVTGGTYNSNSGIATFTNNTGGTFSVIGFYTGSTDIYITGVTFSNNLLSLYRNDGVILGANINSFTSLTVNGSVSATTFYGDGSNLTGISTQDTFVTGGTYSAGTAVFTNNTGGTFNVTGFSTSVTTDVFVTGATKSNDVATFVNNTGGTFTLTGLTDTIFTGGTVANPTYFINGLTATTISATTYLNLPTDIRVTGGTYYDGVTTFTNNTGGTFTTIGPSNYFAGVILGAENWVSNGNGSINLPEIKVALFDNPDNIEPLRIYTIASGTTGVGGIPALTNNDTNYIIIEYNGGSPRYNVLDNDGTVTSSDVVLYMILYRANNFVHTLEFGNMGAGLTNKLNTRLISTDRFARESGCVLGLSGSTGIVTLSSGVVWNGPYEQIVTAVNSQDDIFFKSFHSGGTWVYATTGNTINNDYYDDGTDLVLATAGKYLVNWYFRGQEINDHLYELISYGEYNTIQLAEASPEPNLPELITSHAFLVGRIIVEVSATTGITQSAFNTVFQPSGAPVSHNDLAGIQGGLAGQYYHLDSNKYNNLALTNTNNNFSVGQSFNNGLTATTISATTYQNLPLDSIATSGTTLYSTSPATSDFSTSNSLFLGSQAGNGATGASSSNFIGFQAGSGATNANDSNFLGQQAGQGATNANSSNFFGPNAGNGATNANSSTFIGRQAGLLATGATNSNFFGGNAGFFARSAFGSNFFGQNAGFNATDASASNFFGISAGQSATNANDSNFMGPSAGFNATNANNSNFFGVSAGFGATNASRSNFMGNSAGNSAINASFSTFIGFNAGRADVLGSVGSNNIIIGTNISLSAGTTDSINIGGILFGTGTYSITGGTSSVIPQANGRIGIGIVTPTETLHVSGNTRIEGGLSATTISATTYQNIPQQLTNTFFDSYIGTRLTPTDTSINGFGIIKSVNEQIGFRVRNGDTSGNGAVSSFAAGGAGGLYENSVALQFFGQNYFVPYLRNTGGIYSTNNLNIISVNNSTIDFRIGGTFGSETSRLLISTGGTLNTGNFSATTISATTYLNLPSLGGSIATSGTTLYSTSPSTSNFSTSNSIFFGASAGNGATVANNSNFIGAFAGQSATNADNSNFLGQSAGRSATNTSNSNFMGRDAGRDATNANGSNFLGQNAGSGATNANTSNFIGPNAGFGATSANNSNFIGNTAGFGATGANNSNFLGRDAGLLATGAQRSNFFGTSAGNNATSASESNFIGFQAGSGSTNANNSNFIGNTAGRGATGANNSNFFGRNTGQNATSATDSNFFGFQAGFNATFAYNSNFLGPNAGNAATNAYASNFLGQNAGNGAINAAQSNFMGASAGSQATNAFESNFIGWQAGQSAISARTSNFFGTGAGYEATSARDSNFIGFVAGFRATNASNSNFLGPNAGLNATNASDSNFMGSSAGNGVTNASNSNFIGNNAGSGATNANNSNFFGREAGNQSTGANNSNFMGDSAGRNATSAIRSNFFGNSAGRNATNANNSNFLGSGAGSGATNANNSNFLGNGAGSGATNANNSNFLGNGAGNGATGASFSTLVGFQAGFTSSAENTIGRNNIVIGTNITLPSGSTNSINLGGVLFGTGTYSLTAGTPSFSAQTNGRIGIGVVVPTETLHVSGNTRIEGGLSATTISATTISATTISATTYLNLPPADFSGGTVTGPTNFTNGLTATTISATTYQNLPLDIRVTGGTYSDGTATFTNNAGGTFNVTGLTTPFTGGTVNGVTNFTGGLGVGVAVPTTRLHISGATFGDSGLRLETLTSVTPVSLGQAIGVDGNGNIVTINNVSGSTGPRPITTVIADTTLTDLDQVVIVDSTTPITITLPQITISGRIITIKNVNIGTETILAYSGQLIDGDTSVVVARRNVSLDFQSYNNNWYII